MHVRSESVGQNEQEPETSDAENEIHDEQLEFLDARCDGSKHTSSLRWNQKNILLDACDGVKTLMTLGSSDKVIKKQREDVTPSLQKLGTMSQDKN